MEKTAMMQGVVADKEYRKDHEAGSGSLYIPILGDLFPHLFGQKMNPVDKWFVIIGQESLYRYEVPRELYDSIAIGDHVEIGTDRYGMPDLKRVENK